MRGERVLVVGGGIAGLTAAAALAGRDFAVELVERKPQLGDDAGVGLTLIANAMRALDAIGAAEPCVAAGVPADSVAVCRPDGMLVAEIPSPRIGGPRWPGGTGISRAAFHRILVQATTAAGVSVSCGVTVTGRHEIDDGVEIAFSDGRSAHYALVVAAEGLYSATRAELMPTCLPALTGQSIWRAETSRPADVRRTHLYFGGRHGVVGVCPIDEARCYIYVVEATVADPRRDPRPLHLQLQDLLEGYGGMVVELGATVDRPEKVSYRPLEWILAPRPWGAGRVILIGDAAHANPPVLAQGAAMGIEDAVVLAEEMSRAGSVAEALSRTLDRRYDRARGVVERSRQLAHWEVDHTPGVDVGAVMRANAEALAVSA